MTTAKKQAAARIVKRIYLGKPGGSMPMRVLQGVGAGLLTVVLVGAVLPNHKDAATELSATSPHSSDRAAGESDAARRDRLAGEAAARAAADRAATDQAAAAQAAADKAAADQAAKVKAATVKAATIKAAAARTAAAKAAADKAAADKAAADRAAAAAAAPAAAPAAQNSNCTPAYPDFCIPQRSGDAYNCADFTQNNFTALPEDPYRLDRDRDGIACES
jgi:hypothetical protein